MAGVQVRDMAARLASATARPRPRGTRCNRRFQAHTRVASITAHQASAQGTRCKRRLQTRPPGIRARQASAQGTRMRRQQ
jgi:hypothetical protein